MTPEDTETHRVLEVHFSHAAYAESNRTVQMITREFCGVLRFGVCLLASDSDVAYKSGVVDGGAA